VVRELQQIRFMRLGLLLVALGIFITEPILCLAQDVNTPRANPMAQDGPTLRAIPATRFRGDEPTPPRPPDNATDVDVTAVQVKRLLDKWHPVHERLVQDDRLRVLSGVVGLGVVAYEGIRSRQHVPLAFIGTEALRIGLHPQLSAVRERTGFSVEPSLGYRRFELTFRKTLD
jgi:hypothetical protein